MLAIQKNDDRAVVYFRACATEPEIRLDWDALTSRAGLNIIALASLGLGFKQRMIVNEFIKRPERAQLPGLVEALVSGGARFNAQTRKEVIDAIKRGMDLS